MWMLMGLKKKTRANDARAKAALAATPKIGSTLCLRFQRTDFVVAMLTPET
jgi:hypothetical protein